MKSATPTTFLKWAFPLFKHGADAFYCSGSLATVRAMADHALAGLRPCRADPVARRPGPAGSRPWARRWTARKLVWNQCKALEEAGAFAVEIEVVPHSITQAIAERTNLFLISMGAGAAGHAQYLFSDDVLGQNRGQIPRHAKVYADFAAEYARLQQKRVAAMKAFRR